MLHPAHGRLDEILQRELETARSEEVLGVSTEHAFAKRADKFVGDAAHTFARFLRRALDAAIEALDTVETFDQTFAEARAAS